MCYEENLFRCCSRLLLQILRMMIAPNVFTILSVTAFFPICLSNDLYSDKVLKYDSETFKKNVGGPLPHFINFFAPWCAYCKRLKPVWDELAEKYNKDLSDQKIVIAKVDCTAETPTCAQEDVSGYPSLIFYGAGETKGVKYQGKRDLLGLEEFITNSLKGKDKIESLSQDTSKVIPSVVALQLSDEDFHQTLDYGMHFVKFYAPWCGHCQKMAGTWEELAVNMQHDKSIKISKIDCTVNKMACTEFEVKGFPTLLFIVNGKKVEKYQGPRKLENFKQFITEMKIAHQDTSEVEDEQTPEVGKEQANMVVELSADNFENAVAKGFSFVKFYVPWCGHSKRLAPIWNSLANKFVLNPEVKITKVDCTQDEELCAEHKVVGYPSLFVYRNGKFVTEYHGPRKLENLHSFVLEHLHHTEL